MRFPPKKGDNSVRPILLLANKIKTTDVRKVAHKR